MTVICDKCANYHPSPSGTDAYYYTACKEYDLTTMIAFGLTRYDKERCMDGVKKSCRGFVRL